MQCKIGCVKIGNYIALNIIINTVHIENNIPMAIWIIYKLVHIFYTTYIYKYIFISHWMSLDPE